MIKLIITLISVSASYLLTAQDIITADSISMGPKSVFMDVCTSNMKSNVLNTVELYSTLDFCNCMADELLPTYTKAQITYYFTQGHMTEMFEDKKSRKILIDCLEVSSNSIPPPNEIIESEE